jgi:hypothetical protein
VLHKQYLLLSLQAHITRPTDKATQITVLRLWKNGKRCRQASTGASERARGVSTSLNLCHCEKVPAKVMMQCKAQEGAGGSDEMRRSRVHAVTADYPLHYYLTHLVIFAHRAAR